MRNCKFTEFYNHKTHINLSKEKVTYLNLSNFLLKFIKDIETHGIKLLVFEMFVSDF
jgi:hypothetical protein